MTPPLILVADDDPAIRGLFVAALRHRGMRVIEAENGSVACTMAREQQPNCIVLDWMMPVMDGCAAIALLRADARTCDIPIVMLTAQDTVGEKCTALDAGAQDYLIKPVSPRELHARVRAQIRWREQLANVG